MAKKGKLLSAVSVALLAALCVALPVADRVWYGGALLGGGTDRFCDPCDMGGGAACG